MKDTFGEGEKRRKEDAEGGPDWEEVIPTAPSYKKVLEGRKLRWVVLLLTIFTAFSLIFLSTYLYVEHEDLRENLSHKIDMLKLCSDSHENKENEVVKYLTDLNQCQDDFNFTTKLLEDKTKDFNALEESLREKEKELAKMKDLFDDLKLQLAWKESEIQAISSSIRRKAESSWGFLSSGAFRVSSSMSFLSFAFICIHKLCS